MDDGELANLNGPALEHYLAREVRRAGAFGLTFTSRGRRYTFTWHQKGQCLRVRIGGPAYNIIRPNIEALAKQLRAVQVCVECGKSFPRNGKQRFCTERHASIYRKRRWRRTRHEEKLTTGRAAFLTEIEADHEHTERSSGGVTPWGIAPA